jgi:hypothetical protein
MSDNDSEKSVCPESTLESAKRRDFIKKAAMTTAAAAVGSSVLSNMRSESSASSAGEVNVKTTSGTNPGLCTLKGHFAIWYACCTSNGYGCLSNMCYIHSINSCLAKTSTFLTANSPNPTLCIGNTGAGSAILASASSGNALCATAKSGTALRAVSTAGDNPAILGLSPGNLIAKFKNTKCSELGTGCSTALIQFENGTACAPSCRSSTSAWNVGVSGVCNGLAGCGVDCGVFYIARQLPSTRLAMMLQGCGNVIMGTSGGRLGIGTKTPSTALDVAGTVSVTDNIYVDLGNSNNGSTLHQGGLIFGCYPACGGSGEGISSNRNTGFTCCTNNLFGLDFYAGQKKRMSVTNGGRVGVNTCAPKTTFEVNGSVSGRVAFPSTCYIMDPKCKPEDYAVFASAKSKAFKVTLPAASSGTGRMVFIKKTDCSSNTVTIVPGSSDSIEGKPKKVLAKQYDSLQLMSNGTHGWMLMGNAICGAFTS